MKKSILAIACALFLGQSMFAQGNQEVTYVEDPAQGVLVNKMHDNWFIGLEGGVNYTYLRGADNLKSKDRFSPAASIVFGKWFSPVFGLRGNLDWYQAKALVDEKGNNFGIAGDLMVNLTNWWCGYRPGRVYNISLYAGAGVYFPFLKNDAGDWKRDDTFIGGRVGLLNTFNVAENWQLLIDLRIIVADKGIVVPASNTYMPQALIGFNYCFNKARWTAPVVPVYPEPENCDALRARLQTADARIADLEAQLKACLERPVQTVVEGPKAPLATIYFPINSYRLNRSDINVLGAIANIMKSNPNQKYVLTGYADNYTGTDAFNARLRQNRANSVQKQLVRAGVNATQLEATTNAKNLCDLGEKYVALDRCVTIEEAK